MEFALQETDLSRRAPCKDLMKMIATPRHSCQFEIDSERDRWMHAAAMEVLSNSQYAPLRQLTCRVCEGVVEISGTVSSFYLKQLAQVAVQQLHPSGQVRNLVEVTGETQVAVATCCGPLPVRTT
jgi:hypothetical protein